MLGAILAEAGFSIFENLIKDNGDALVKKGIEKVTGIKLDKKKPLTAEQIKRIEDKKMDILNLDFKKIALEYSHEEELRKQSHDTYKISHDMSDKIASQVIGSNLLIISLLVMVNVGVLYYFKDNSSLIAIVSNIIGVAIGNLFAERQAIINFFFGSSMGSKQKTNELIKAKNA